MSSIHLSLPLRLPDEERERYNRLDTLTTQTANILINQYWTPDHLTEVNDSSHQAWKYFDEHEAFEGFDTYLPSRYKRCLLQKVGETLRSHADKRDAFQTIKSLLPDHKIRRIHTRRIKDRLWDSDEYLSSGYVDVLIDQLNAYYDVHGEYLDTYFDLQTAQNTQRVYYRIQRMMAQQTDKLSNTDTTNPRNNSPSNTKHPIHSNQTRMGIGRGLNTLLMGMTPFTNSLNMVVSPPHHSNQTRQRGATTTTSYRSPSK
jgi:hypothetical protein